MIQVNISGSLKSDKQRALFGRHVLTSLSDGPETVTWGVSLLNTSEMRVISSDPSFFARN